MQKQGQHTVLYTVQTKDVWFWSELISLDSTKFLKKFQGSFIYNLRIK